MAKTHGHGNPKWTRDETILALDLYFQLQGKIPSSNDERVQELSRVLRELPYHASSSRQDSFRNPDGVGFKLQNLRNVATGKGLGNVAEMDREVWRDFRNQADKVRQIATAIRESVNVSAKLEEVDDADVVFSEGRLLTKLHSLRERNPKLRRQLISTRHRSRRLFCEICGEKPRCTNPFIADAQFEAHHLLPLWVSGQRSTRLSDMALLCASCHRLLHRAIAVEKRWLTLQEAKSLFRVAD